MRETYKMKRWISFCLIIILAVSGVCFEQVKTDPSFAVSSQTSPELLQSLSPHYVEQDMCSAEQLGDSMLRGATEVLKRTASGQRSRGLSKVRSFGRVSIPSYISHGGYILRRIQHTASSIITYGSIIITYIHQQDGSKG